MSNKKEKLFDELDEFLAQNENLPDKDGKLKKESIKKTFSFDLHGYSLDEANKKVADLIQDAYNQGVNKLIIVIFSIKFVIPSLISIYSEFILFI